MYIRVYVCTCRRVWVQARVVACVLECACVHVCGSVFVYVYVEATCTMWVCVCEDRSPHRGS